MDEQTQDEEFVVLEEVEVGDYDDTEGDDLPEELVFSEEAELPEGEEAGA